MTDFFLGNIINPADGEATGENVSYDRSDLTTHGVIVGMTGSGKTGLGVILLEEALMSGIPVLAIDPKGDMGNLALTFPNFTPADFEPWVSADEARQEGISTGELAQKTADKWKSGIGSWDPTHGKIASLSQIPVSIYTPGSGAGIPVNILGSLKAPDLDWDTESETILGEIDGLVSSLLTLAGVDSDPVSGREHILLANIVAKAWREGHDLDLSTLIGQVHKPPIRKLGVFEVDAFFPEKDRLALAMQLNGVVASPTFSSWLNGPPLDIQSMLYDGDQPRAAVVYLAHLNDEERQFVVTLLLSKVVSWMRGLSGASDLRALVYMDEVFGFAPPSAAPPSKKPILTMLKQARAFGVGLVLSTQNPVDLDYKAMSNTGTWMVGRLQTERDKARILEALESAAGGTDIGAIDSMVSGLGKRQFLLHNTRESEPSVFSTRWAMSYLRGPLTKDEISRLTEEDRQALESTSAASTTSAQPAAAAEPPLADDETSVAPTVADSISVYYLDKAAPWAQAVGADHSSSRLQPALAARVHLTFDETKADLDHSEEWEAVFFPLKANFDPESAIVVDYDERDFEPDAPDGATYVLAEAPIDSAQYFRSAQTEIKDYLYRHREVSVNFNPTLKIYSRIGETEDEFQERVDRAATDAADAEIAKVTKSYETKIERSKDSLTTAYRRMQELETDLDTRKREELMSGASDLLGMVLGGRRKRSLSGAARRRGQSQRTAERLRTAQSKLADYEADVVDLEQELMEAVADVEDKWEDVAAEIDTLEVGLEKTDISVDEVRLVYIPS
jgi:hypothetical protein